MNEKEIPNEKATVSELFAKEILINVNELRNKELQKALNLLGELDNDKKKIVEELTKTITESIISTPFNNIEKEKGLEKNNLFEAASKIFDCEKKIMK